MSVKLLFTLTWTFIMKIKWLVVHCKKNSYHRAGDRVLTAFLKLWVRSPALCA